MTHDITIVNPTTAILGVSFIDEGIELTEHVQIDGGKEKALAYLPFFEKDMRREYAHLFPQPVQPEGGMMNEIR